MIDYSYLRPQKEIALKKWHESDFYKRDDLESLSYSNAVILPIKRIQGDALLFGRGGVVAEGLYIESSGIEKRIYGSYEYNNIEKSNNRVVYCGYWVKQWGHFLVEGAARLWYALENNLDVDKFVFISEENGPTEMYGNYLEFVKLLGIADKVEVINKPTEYREVIVPELGYSRKYYYNNKFKEMFDVIAENAMDKESDFDYKEAPKRVFLSRSQFAKARQAEYGLDFLDHYFEKNGFAILYPEKMSLSKLVCYLRNAEICASASGTVPHNFLFAQTGKRTIIIERQACINEIQANLDIVCDLDVTYIDGHYSLYPVSAGYGPYIFGFTEYMERFTNENRWSVPDDIFCNEKYYKNALKHYLKSYKNDYGYCSGMEEWQMMYADAIYEAYKSSLPKFEQWLKLSKPLYFRQYFSIRSIKKIIKKILGRA